MKGTKGTKIIDNISKNEPSEDGGNDDVKLEDFKIKKVIDKGSFGKVFLVVH